MQAWFGTESGEGSRKDTGHSHGEELPIVWHAYAECPPDMTDDMQLWLTLTYEDGSEEVRRIPAEIWRRDNESVTKLLLCAMGCTRHLRTSPSSPRS